jgi:serine/threonine protein kinase
MDEKEARARLGVSAEASPAHIRAAYLQCVRGVGSLAKDASDKQKRDYQATLDALLEARTVLIGPEGPPSGSAVSADVLSPSPIKSGAILFGHFKLQRALGSGGEGGMWLADDQRQNLAVALWFLPESLCRDPGARADLQELSLRSGELIHPNIACTYQCLEEGDLIAVAMEYVEGKSLTQLRLEKPQRIFEVKELKGWVRCLCEALTYAHEQMHLVHGGVEPETLLVNVGGQLKLTCFGLEGRVKAWLIRLRRDSQREGLTASGEPAQLLEVDPTVGDDVHGVGATLYELLTGTPPFEGEEVGLEPRVRKPVGSLAQRRTELGIGGEAIPATWEQTVAACLAEDPTQRPQSVREVSKRLDDDGPPNGSLWTKVTAWLRQRPRMAGAGAIVFLVIVSAIVFFSIRVVPPRVPPVKPVEPSNTSTATVTPSTTHPEVLFAQGEAFRNGDGVPKDLHKAFVCYLLAAEQGLAGAQHRVGLAYSLGEGAVQNDSAAVAWYKKAAEQGFAKAEHDLGVCYVLGRGVEKDVQTGMNWWRKAADQGDQQAIDALHRQK